MARPPAPRANADGGLRTSLYADVVVMGRTFRVETAFGSGDTIFGVRLGDVSLGEILQYLVSLVPGAGHFSLDAPWSALNEVPLRNLELQLNATTNAVGFTYDQLNLNLAFARIDVLELWYGPGDAAGATGEAAASSLQVKLYGRFLDKTYAYPDQPLGWDLLRQPPPAVPSGGPPAFDLDYLGLGQRVTLRDARAFTSMQGIIDALVASYADVDGAVSPLRRLPALKFDGASGWLVGARFSALDTITLSVIFNDPTMYGLRVELRGERAKAFAGLQFEILYRRIGDGLGVYHVDLRLPDAMRRFDLGAVSLSLPLVVVDVYTNGDFLLDLGFPYDLDFTRAFALSTFVGPVPVVGAGGIKFGALSGATSTLVPRVTNGRLAPVIAFGLGLRIGVGKELQSGAMSGGMLVTLDGLLEGVLAFFEPEHPGLPKDTYFRVHGAIRIAAHVYGRIDFKVIQASLDVYAYAQVSVAMEAYAATVIVLEAGVHASVRVKVLFATVTLSFSTTVRARFTIGTASPPPWTIEAPATARALAAGAPAGFRLLPGGAVQAVDAYAALRDRPLPWRAGLVLGERRTLDVFIGPMVTLGVASDYPAPPGPTGAGAAPDEARGVQLLLQMFVSLGETDPARAAGFDALAQAELLWALQNVHDGLHAAAGRAAVLVSTATTVTRSALEFVQHDLTAANPRAPITYCRIVDFLRENFRFRVRAMPADGAVAAGVTLFPVPPYLTLSTSDAGVRVDFETFDPCSEEYVALLEEYFRQLAVPVDGSGGTGGPPAHLAPESTSSAPTSLAAVVFGDYFTLILREMVRASLDVFDGLTVTPATGESLTALVHAYGVAGVDPLRDIALANQDAGTFFAAGSVIPVPGLRAQVREGETLAGFSARFGFEPTAFVTSQQRVLGLLAVGATIAIPGPAPDTGRVETIRPGDTWAGLAEAHQCTVEALAADPANLASPDLLAKQFTIALPPVTVGITSDARLSPRAIAQRLGIDVGEVVAAAETAGVAYETVRLPAFEQLPAGALFAELTARGAFAAAAAMTARSFLGGTRLPDPRRTPAGAPRGTRRVGDPSWSDEPLYPLAILTGQQWAAPPVLPADYRITLTRNLLTGDAECQRPEIVFESAFPDSQIDVALSAADVAAVTAFRELLKRPAPFAPNVLSVTRQAPYAVAERRFPVGVGRPWVTPAPLPFASAGQATGTPLVFDLPDDLRTQLAASPPAAPDVRLMTGPPGVAGAPAPEAREIAARAWATRVRFLLARVESPGRPDAFIAGLYTVRASDVTSSRLLLQAMAALAPPSTPGATGPPTPRLDLLYPSNAADPLGASLQSDAVTPAEVLLVKANLSTDTHAPTRLTGGTMHAAPPDASGHATLAEPLPFLRLLWEACVTNAGGFYLRYHAGEGESLPAQLFNQSETAPFELLITAVDTTGAPVRAQAHHNAVICAENLASGAPNVFVAPPVVAAPKDATLAAIAKALGAPATQATLALANATTRHLLRPGLVVALPDSGRYTVQVGDTLLDLALREKTPDLARVAAAVDAVKNPLVEGATLHVDTGWVRRQGVIPPGTAGLRVLRTDPDPSTGEAAPPDRQAAPETRLQVLFNLLTCRLAPTAAFRAGPSGLPVPPATDALPPPAAPWRYSRRLGIAPFAASPNAADDPWADPYVGLGGEAAIAFDLLDVFGNRVLPAGSVPTLTVPIRYGDAVVPLAQWPSIVSSFDARQEAQLDVRLTFDAGHYAPSTSGSVAATASRAAADGRLMARIAAQLGQPDVVIGLWASFGLGEVRGDKAALLDLAAAAIRYLDTVGGLRALTHAAAAGEVLRAIAARYRVDVVTLATANALDARVLAASAVLSIPTLYVTVLTDSLGAISDRFGGDPDPGALARLNAGVRLQPGVRLTIGQTVVAARAGDTLTTVASRADVPLEDIGRANAGVEHIFPSGTQVLVRMSTAPVRPGDTLSHVAAAHGLALGDLAAANADTAGWLAAGAVLAIPLHATIAPEHRTATVTIADGDCLGSIATGLGIGVDRLARANADVTGLLRVGAALRYRPAGAGPSAADETLPVAEHDTLATLLAALRARPGCHAATLSALAAQNTSAPGLLAPGAWCLAPPEDVVQTFAPGRDQDLHICPLAVELRIRRASSLIDPALTDDAGTGVAASPVAPHLTSDPSQPGDDALSLRDFGRRFADAFDGLRLATSGDAPAAAGATAAATGRLMVVAWADVSYLIDTTPFFFAPRPLLNRLWSSDPAYPVPVPRYAAGAITGATDTLVTGVDLDRVGRAFLAAIDRALSPAIGVTACERLGAGAEYDQILAAKAALARAVRNQVTAVVDPPPQTAPPDLEAARDALHQRLLVELASGYDVDAVVQFPARVQSPFADPATAPRLAGRVTAVSFTVPDDATLERLAQHFDAPVSTFARLAADLPYLLCPGATVLGHEIAATDTLRTVADALGRTLEAFAAAVARTGGLFQAGASLGLVTTRRAVQADDTIGVLLDRLAPGVPLAPALQTFLEMNGATPGLVAGGATVALAMSAVRTDDTLDTVAVRAGVTALACAESNRGRADVLLAGAAVDRPDRHPYTIREGETFDSLAAAMGSPLADVVSGIASMPGLLRPGATMAWPPEAVKRHTAHAGESLEAVAAALQVPVRDLAEGVLDDPGLLEPAVTVGYLARAPECSITTRKLTLVNGASPLTFLVALSRHAAVRSIGVDLTFAAGELEYDIQDAKAQGYQSSRWLTFAEPLQRPLARIDVPIALRSYPRAPVMLSQEIRYAEAPADLQALKTYDYAYTYAYSGAAQDQLQTDVEINLPDPALARANSDPRDTLPYWLAKYDGIAAALWTDLGVLATPDALDSAPLASAARGALHVLAEMAAGIARAWSAWTAAPVADAALPAPRFHVRCRDVGGGHVRATIGARAGDAGRPLPPSAPGLLVRARRLEGPAAGGRLARSSAAPAGPDEAGGPLPDLVLSHVVRGLDLIQAQNIRGYVDVTRNVGLLPDRATRPEFVYAIDRVTALEVAWPLVVHHGPVDMASAAPLPQPRPRTLWGRLASFFAALLEVTPASPEHAGRDVRIGVSFLLPLNGGAGSDGPTAAATAIVATVPVALRPAAAFVPARDLTAADGACAQLADAMTAWMGAHGAPPQGGVFVFDVTVFARLGTTAPDAGGRPLLSLTNVRLALADVDPATTA
ncbi:MAG: LysM peptidoglycan-binding domain-containing protein [Vicinamibacterales bacterium]